MFDPVRRTILVVEDEVDIQENIVAMCRIVRGLLSKQNLHIDLKILRAHTLDEAKQIIEQQLNDIDLILIDIALKQEERGLAESQLLNLTPGGLQVLQRFEETGTLAIIYSGETAQSYIQDAYVRYGVLRFIRKSKEDELLIPAVKTALWYLTTLDSIMLPLEDLDRRDIGRAERAWQYTIESAAEASIRITSLPQQLDSQIAQVRALYIHTDTDLPVGAWTEAKLRKYIIAPAEEWAGTKSIVAPEWGLIRCKLNGFQEFIADYASQKPALMQLFANAIEAVISENFADEVVFVGHLDRDFLYGNPYLIIILKTNDVTVYANLQAAMEQQFALASTKVLPSHDIHEQFNPAQYQFSLQFKQWSNDEKHEFYDLHSTLDILNSGWA